MAKTTKKSPIKTTKKSPGRPPKSKTQAKTLVPEIIDDEALEGESSASSRALATTDPVTLYMAEIRKYPLLSKEEEHKLAVQYYETKDPAAAEKLIKSNLRFVVKVAAEYSKFGAKLIDLVQEGNIGLMHAVRDFNPYKGVRLITYAVWWIRGYIQEYLMKQFSMVKIGTTHNQKKLFYNLQKEKEALDALGQETDFALIGQRLGIPEDEVKEMSQRLSGRDISLNQPLDHETSGTLIDVQASKVENIDEQLGHAEELEVLKEKIGELRPQLNEKELFILDNRLLSDEPMTLQEIGTKYKTTREAVRQMEERVMKKIREIVKPSLD